MLNTPIIWRFIQWSIGATQWKNRIYPSVIKKSGKLLDFGCSVGITTASFLDHDYYGVDVDEVAIDAAKKRFCESSNVHFFCQDILKERLEDNFFDNILFFGTAHHVSDEVFLNIIHTLMKSLREEGELHFFDPIIQKDKDGLITKLLIKHDQGKWMRTEDYYSSFFKKIGYPIREWKIFESPRSLIKLQDFLYVRLTKNPTIDI